MARRVMAIYREERVASLVAAAGVIWAMTVASSALPTMALPAGPVETCGVGVVLWLHAKWRRSLKVH